MTRQVYMYHMATIPVLPEVLEAMLPYFTRQYGHQGPGPGPEEKMSSMKP